MNIHSGWHEQINDNKIINFLTSESSQLKSCRVSKERWNVAVFMQISQAWKTFQFFTRNVLNSSEWLLECAIQVSCG